MIEKIFKRIDEERESIIKLSNNIHSNPEVAFQEYKTSGFIIDQLTSKGYEVKEKVGGLDTAFTSRKSGADNNLKIALLAEYDALPILGHACGHNIIAAAAYGAYLGLASFIDDYGGELLLIGTPAEESGGGKIILLEEGIFDNIDYAMMIHPSSKNLVNRGGLAIVTLKLEYKGKASHSSSPELGINALNAVIQTFNAIDAIKAEFPLKTNINGIIKKGGDLSNVIPSISECEFSIRAATLFDLKIVMSRLKSIVKSVEVLTGAKANYSFDQPYSERYSNKAMDEVFKEKMILLGETVEYPDPKEKIGSSDIGNVSLKLPIIHPYVKICDDISGHTPEFEEAAVSETANNMLIKASKAMAATAYEIFTDKDLRSAIKKEFRETVPDYSKLGVF